MAKDIIVVGGGIVGICSALLLQQSGHNVRLIDAKEPGRETSYGNAGVLAEASFLVLNSPALLRMLPRMLLNQTLKLRVNHLFLLKRLPWFLKFLSYCRRAHVLHAAGALRQLLTMSLAIHKDLIQAAGVGHLLRQTGWLKLFRTEVGFTEFCKELKVIKSFGARFTVYDREHLRQIEPGLEPIYCKAVLMDDTCTVSSPAELSDAYVRLFQAAGGVVEQTKVTALNQQEGVWCVQCRAQKFTADEVVLAAGAWSAEMASWLGYKIPMAWERGYHLHLQPGDGPALRRPIHDIEAGFVMSPMNQGMRVTSGVELTDRDAPPNYRQINYSVEMARQAYNMKERVDQTPWMGRRPTLIDSLPMIGAAPRHDGLWFNFGHQHLGLSLAPGSAQLLKALIENSPPPTTAAAFSPTRFYL